MKVAIAGVHVSQEIPQEQTSVVFAGPVTAALVFLYFTDTERRVGRIEMSAKEFRTFAYQGTQILADNKVPD